MAFRKKNNLLLNKLNARSSQAQIEITEVSVPNYIRNAQLKIKVPKDSKICQISVHLHQELIEIGPLLELKDNNLKDIKKMYQG